MTRMKDKCLQWLARLDFEIGGDPQFAALLEALRARVEGADFSTPWRVDAIMEHRAALLHAGAFPGVEEKQALRLPLENGAVLEGKMESQEPDTLNFWSTQDGFVPVPVCFVPAELAALIAPLAPWVGLQKALAHIREFGKQALELRDTAIEQAGRVKEVTAWAIEHIEESAAAEAALTAEVSALTRRLEDPET